jgi:hypothetical protein
MLAIVGLMAGPFVASSPSPIAEQVVEPRDPRLVRLERYFTEKNCPVKPLAKEFVAAADEHHLDWRLLPSIAFIESGGGKEYQNNNIFGWKNGKHRFRSVRHGIHTVAERLANSHYYRNKSLDAVLYTYNPIQGYRERVKFVMDDLGPAHVTPPPAAKTRLLLARASSNATNAEKQGPSLLSHVN